MSTSTDSAVGFETDLLERFARQRVERTMLPLRGDEDVVGLVVVDRGPGLRGLHMALRDGYTTGGGLGLGLGGSKRLVDEFEIETPPGEGTLLAIVKCKR